MGKYDISLDERYRLVDASHDKTRVITINGKAAVICEAQSDFAMVRSLQGSISAEYAWSTVKHVVDNLDGKFKA